MRNDSRICRPYGAWGFVVAFSTEMSLLTELVVTGKSAGPSLYHLLEVFGKEKSLARIERTLGISPVAPDPLVLEKAEWNMHSSPQFSDGAFGRKSFRVLRAKFTPSGKDCVRRKLFDASTDKSAESR